MTLQHTSPFVSSSVYSEQHAWGTCAIV